MWHKAKATRLRKRERIRLERIARGDKSQQKIRLRARIILGADEGKATTVLARELNTSRPTVLLWCKRYAEKGIDGLYDAPRSGRPRVLETPDSNIILSAIRKHLNELESQGVYSLWIPSRVAHDCQADVGTVNRIWRAYRRRYRKGIFKRRRRAVSQAFFEAERKASPHFSKRFKWEVIKGPFVGEDCYILEQLNEFPEYVRLKFRCTSLIRFTPTIPFDHVALKGPRKAKLKGRNKK
jgi:transposase